MAIISNNEGIWDLCVCHAHTNTNQKGQSQQNHYLLTTNTSMATLSLQHSFIVLHLFFRSSLTNKSYCPIRRHTDHTHACTHMQRGGGNRALSDTPNAAFAQRPGDAWVICRPTHKHTENCPLYLKTQPLLSYLVAYMSIAWETKGWADTQLSKWITYGKRLRATTAMAISTAYGESCVYFCPCKSHPGHPNPIVTIVSFNWCDAH